MVCRLRFGGADGNDAVIVVHRGMTDVGEGAVHVVSSRTNGAVVVIVVGDAAVCIVVGIGVSVSAAVCVVVVGVSVSVAIAVAASVNSLHRRRRSIIIAQSSSLPRDTFGYRCCHCCVDEASAMSSSTTHHHYRVGVVSVVNESAALHFRNYRR